MEETAADIVAGFEVMRASGVHSGLLVSSCADGAGGGGVAETPEGAKSPGTGPSGFFSISLGAPTGAATARSGPPAPPPGGSLKAKADSSEQPRRRLAAAPKADLDGPRRPAQPSAPTPAKQHRPRAPAAPVAAGSAGSADNKQNKGRPRRNLVGDTEKLRHDFTLAVVGDKTFFGVGQKAMIQWVARLVDAITERLSEMTAGETAEEQAALVKQKKVASAVLALLRACRKSGPDSEECREVARQQMDHLTMPPSVETNVFPLFIRTSARKAVALMEDSAERFWEMLGPTNLGDGGMTLQEIQALQQEIITEKLANLQSSAQGLPEKLEALLSKAEFRKSAGLVAGMEKELDALRVLACHRVSSPEEISEAIACAKDAGMPLVSSLKMSHAGRELIDEAQKSKERLQLNASRSSKLSDAVKRMVEIRFLAERAWDHDAIAAAVPQGLKALSQAAGCLEEEDFKYDRSTMDGLLKEVVASVARVPTVTHRLKPLCPQSFSSLVCSPFWPSVSLGVNCFRAVWCAPRLHRTTLSLSTSPLAGPPNLPRKYLSVCAVALAPSDMTQHMSLWEARPNNGVLGAAVEGRSGFVRVPPPSVTLSPATRFGTERRCRVLPTT